MDLELMKKLNLKPAHAAVVWNIVNFNEGDAELFDGAPTRHDGDESNICKK